MAGHGVMDAAADDAATAATWAALAADTLPGFAFFHSSWPLFRSGLDSRLNAGSPMDSLYCAKVVMAFPGFDGTDGTSQSGMRPAHTKHIVSEQPSLKLTATGGPYRRPHGQQK